MISLLSKGETWRITHLTLLIASFPDCPQAGYLVSLGSFHAHLSLSQLQIPNALTIASLSLHQKMNPLKDSNSV